MAFSESNLKLARKAEDDRPHEPRGSIMDIPLAPKSRKRRYLYTGFGVLVVVALTLFLAGLDPAAPSVDRDVVIIGTVERGSFVRQVRGPGTLVPEQLVYISAVSGGRVDEVRVDPGAMVKAGMVLLELSNPDVELEALQAQQQLTASRAGLVELRRNLGMQLLAQEGAVASARADYEEARRLSEGDSALVAQDLIPRNQAETSHDQATAAVARLKAETGRLELLQTTMQDQIAVQQEQIERLQSIYRYQEQRVASMQVKAPTDGVLQDLSLEVGQWVQSGTALARIAQPGRLKAELRIPETQARDIQIGQTALIDTRSDTVDGHVSRFNPNVQNGSVLVEVTLDGDLPPGARPNLSVDGTIQIERLDNVLNVDRPAYGQSNSTVGLFKLVEGGDEAVRVTARLGRSSVNRIEVIEGLKEGDRIILSDMSRWDEVDRVEIR